MFMLWKRQKGYEATYEKMAYALMRSGRSDLAEYVTDQEAKTQLPLSQTVTAGGAVKLKTTGTSEVYESLLPKGKYTLQQHHSEELSGVIDNNTLQFLCTSVGREWIDVGRNLGLSEPRIYMLRADYRWNQNEMIHNMFLLWRRIKGPEATYQTMMVALAKSGRKDLADYIAEVATRQFTLRQTKKGSYEDLQKGKETLEVKAGEAVIIKSTETDKGYGSLLQEGKHTLQHHYLEEPSSVIDTKTIQFLCTRLGHDWKYVGRILGLSEKDIYRLQADFMGHNKEMIYQMLLLWRQIEGSNATFKALSQALVWSERKDLADYIVKGGPQSHMSTLDRTQTELQIQPNSSQQPLEMQLIVRPYSLDEPARCFEDHTTPIVEVSPQNLTLQRAATVFIPHCLKLKRVANSDVKIFRSIHEPDLKPDWKDITKEVTFSLSEFGCEIQIMRSGWYKYLVSGTQVEAKWILVYAVGEKSKQDTENVTVSVGYHPYFSKEVYQTKLRDSLCGDSQSFLFFKETDTDVHISLAETIPSWKLDPEKTVPSRKIPYSHIEFSHQKSYTFKWQRPQPSSILPRCVFEIRGSPLQPKSRLVVNFGTLTSPVINDTIVTDDALLRVSYRLKDDWNDIGVHLQVPAHDLHKISQEHHSLQEKGYQMLMAWKSRLGESALVEILAKALKDAYRDELADELTTGGKQILLPSSDGTESSSSLSEDTKSLKIASKSIPKSVMATSDEAQSPSASSVISKEGGIITIYGTGVELHIPPYALEKEHEIQLKILPHHLYGESAKCFEDRSTVMVEILPNRLKLQQPASLFLPHCLKLKTPKQCKVRVLQSHHTEGQKPFWEDITNTVEYSLSDSRCEIKIKGFSWKKYSIRGNGVQAKQLRLYAIGKMCEEDAENVTVEIGYHPDLPSENKLYREKLKEGFDGDAQYFLFRKKPQKDLIISPSGTLPTWNLSSLSKNPEKISYELIESSVEQSRPFIFMRNQATSALPQCVFNIYQQVEQDTSSLSINFARQSQQSQLAEERIVPASETHPQNPLHLQEDRVVKESVLNDLASEILQDQWKPIGRKLRIPEARLDDISARYASLNEKAIQMLITWRQREGRHATKDTLQKAFRDCYRSDLSDKLNSGDNEEVFM